MAVVAAATAVVSDELATESEFVKVERPADLSPMAKKFFDLLDLVKEGVAVSGTDEFDVVASSGSSHNIHYFVSSEDKSFTVRREEVSKEDESDSEIDVLSMEYHEDDKLVHLLLNDVMLFDDHPAQEKAHQNVHTVSEKMSKFTMLFDSYVSDTKKKKAQAEAEKQEREEKKALSSKLRKF